MKALFGLKVAMTALILSAVAANSLDAQTFTSNPNLAIPDSPNAGVTDSINVTGVTGGITSLRVDIRIDHTWDSDLDIWLIPPGTTWGGPYRNGTPPAGVVELSTDNGFNGDDFGTGAGPFVYSQFSSSTDPTSPGTTPIAGLGAAATPFIASIYIPEGSAAFDALYGSINPNGTWTLAIGDDAGGDVGTLFSWQVVVLGGGNLSPVISAERDSGTTPVTINNNDNVQVALNSTVAALDLQFQVTDVNATDVITLAGGVAPSANINGFVQSQWDAGPAVSPITTSPATGTFDTAGTITVTLDADDGAAGGTSQLVFTIEVIAPELAISVTGPTAATVPLPQTDLVVTTFDATADVFQNHTITDVEVTKTGAVSDTDITEVKLWVDVNSNGTLETGTDTQLGTAQTFTAGVTTFTGLSEVVNAGTTTDFLVTYSLSATASGTFGADITAVTATPGSVTGTPATGPTHTAQQPELTISSTGPGAGAFPAPVADRVVATFDASASVGGDQTITDVTVDQSGTVADTDVTEVKLWVDVNSNGTLETATDTQLGSTQTFTAGTTTFASLTEVVTASTTTDFLVTFTLAASATGTVGADVTTVVVNTGTVTGTPATGSVHTILTAVSTLPFIDDFEAGNPGNRGTQITGGFPSGTTTITTVNFTNNSRVQFGAVPQSTSVGPAAGTGHAGIDFPSGDACGAIDYFFDLSAFNASADTIFLRFFYAEDGDESDAEDGVYLSLDGGATWVLNLNVLANGTSTPTQRTIDVSAALVGASLNFTGQEVFRFQGQDNFEFVTGNDGHLFDNVELYLEPEIDVTRNSTSIPHRGTVDVGNINIAGGTETFDIENLIAGSSLDLTDAGPDLMVISNGANLDSVTVSTPPTTPVAGGSSSSFILTIDPTANGAFDFLVSIGNSDTSRVQFANGTDGVLTNATSNFTSATATFVAADVGSVIVISGSGAGNDGVYTIGAVNSATDVTISPAPAADETAVTWSHEVSEDPYTFTVTGTGVTNGSAEADPATGSSFAGPTNGPLTQSVAPGATLAAADVELTDPESDNITVTAITPPGTVPTGIVAPTIPGAPGHPVTLSWTGTADASNPPGDYTWTIEFNDAVNGSTVTCDVTITITDVPPAHAILNALSGDGTSAGTAYTATFAENDTGATSVDLATVTDGNTSQTPMLGTVNEGGGNPTSGVFQFVLSAGILTVAPAGTLVAGDVGTHTFDMNVTDGSNNVTIFVSIDVFGNSGAITFDQTTLPDGTVGSAYTTTLTVTGAAAGALAWSVVAGALPAGLSLNAITGEISGTPTIAATSNFTIRVVDSASDSAQQAFSITINTAGGGGGGGGGGDDSGCSTGTTGFNWLALLGLLGVVALGIRMRASKA